MKFPFELTDDTGGSGFPVWIWLLIAAVLAALGGLAYYFGCRDGKPKKKRTMKVDPAESPMMSNASSVGESFATEPRAASFEPVASPYAYPVVSEPIARSQNRSFIGESRFSEPRLVQQSVGAAVETAVVTQPVETVVAQGPMISEPVGMDIFDMVDRNHDGRVTEAEFAAAFGQRTAQRPTMFATQVVQPPPRMSVVARHQPDLFDMVDRNHDGRISQQEYAQAFGAGTQTRPVGTANFGGGQRNSAPMITEPIAMADPMGHMGSLRPDMDLYTVTPYGTNVHHLHGAAPPPGVPIVSQALIPANLPIVEDNF